MRPFYLLCVLSVACVDADPGSPVAAPEHAPVTARGEAFTDGILARRVPSPDGRWQALIADGGTLVLVGPDGTRHPVEGEFLPEVAFAPDGSFAILPGRPDFESDLFRVALPPSGPPIGFVEWEGAEDRPLISDDGRVAFVSGITGVASIWVAPVDDPDAAVQITNAGVERMPRRPGHPPQGFVPPPDGSRFEWTATGLLWVAEGEVHTVEVPR